MSASIPGTLEPAADLDAATLQAVRDLILVLADSKRLLGTRYAGWILGAPELEAGIACASMAQDEWGHSRLLYALLRDFGDDVERLEHQRQAAEYRNIETLDAAPATWIDLVAVNVLVDAALTTQLDALRASAYAPLRQRAGKLLAEETFHAAHGAAWFRRLLHAGGTVAAGMADAARRVAPACLRWFGPDGAHADLLTATGVADRAGSALRAAYLERLAPLIAEAGLEEELTAASVDFGGFDETTRRLPGTEPDADTIARVRGDRNRAFLMD